MAIAINGNGTITGITAGGLPDASIVDADIAAVAATKLTGTVADARLPTVPVAKGGTGLTAAGASGQVLTSDGTNWASSAAAGGGGDTRNFIIDGDMQVFPEGYKTSITHNTYASSLFTFLHVGAGVIDCTQSTDVPTVGESSHTSGESLFYDITTADASMAASDLYAIRYKMTACDFGYLHQQEATLSFWVKSTKTGTHCVFFNNSALDRSYVSEYTVSSTNTWERKTVTLTFDTSGTWVTTGEAGVGLYLGWAIAGGTDRHGTNNTWQAGQKYMTSSQVNGLDSTSNDFRISQVMLTLGSSAPSAFLGQPISTVRDQVSYYFWDAFSNTVSNEYTDVTGNAVSADAGRFTVPFHRRMRAVPVMTQSAGTSFLIHGGTSDRTLPADQGYTYFYNIGQKACKIQLAVDSSVLTTNQQVMLLRNGTATAYLRADARH